MHLSPHAHYGRICSFQQAPSCIPTRGGNSIRFDSDPGAYDWIIKWLPMHEDASWFYCSVTQLTYSVALVQFTFAVNSVEAKVLPNAGFWFTLHGSDPTVNHLSFLFSYVLPINCPVTLCAALLFYAFFIRSILHYLKFWLSIMNSVESIQNHPHPNHNASKNRFFSPTTNTHIRT